MGQTKIILEDGTEHTFDRAVIEEGFVVCGNRKNRFDEDDPWYDKLLFALTPFGTTYVGDVQSFPEHRIEKMEEV